MDIYYGALDSLVHLSALISNPVDILAAYIRIFQRPNNCQLMHKRQFNFKIDSNTERIQQFIEYQAEVATRIY